MMSAAWSGRQRPDAPVFPALIRALSESRGVALRLEPDLPRVDLLGSRGNRDRRNAGERHDRPSALQRSNVQIAQGFIDRINTQRSFQANTRAITASDQLLGNLINIVR